LNQDGSSLVVMSVGGTRYQSDLQMDGATMNRAVAEPLWTPTDVATYLGIPVQTLYQWRRKAPGLKVILPVAT
jgi:hypothetical protein